MPARPIGAAVIVLIGRDVGLTSRQRPRSGPDRGCSGTSPSKTPIPSSWPLALSRLYVASSRIELVESSNAVWRMLLIESRSDFRGSHPPVQESLV